MTSPPPGTLFVVATPIGNLEDITLRALRVLREVSVIAAEDTRRTANLVRHYQIRTPLVSFHAHNERQRSRELVSRLQQGQSVALVTDAGTPGISDPGAGLVRAARAAGLRVEPVPGPSAVTAALSASGLESDRFVFAGFPPTRTSDREKWFEWVAAHPDVPVVTFEAPHRITRTLAEMRNKLVGRPIVIARELTKAHESWTHLPPDQDAAAAEPADRQAIETKTDTPLTRGELVVIIGPAEAAQLAPARTFTDAEIAKAFGEMPEVNRGGRRAKIKAVADRLGLPAKAVYDALERHKARR